MHAVSHKDEKERPITAPDAPQSLGHEVIGTQRVLMKNEGQAWAVLDLPKQKIKFRFSSETNRNDEDNQLYFRNRGEYIEIKFVNWKSTTPVVGEPARHGEFKDSKGLLSTVMMQRVGDVFIIDIQVLKEL